MSTEHKSVTELAAEHPNLAEYIGQIENERDHLHRKVFKLGTWKCDKCNFEQNNRVINATTGEIGVRAIEEVQICPNDGQIMRRVTWEECSQDNYKMCCKLLDERDVLRKQLIDSTEWFNRKLTVAIRPVWDPEYDAEA